MLKYDILTILPSSFTGFTTVEITQERASRRFVFPPPFGPYITLTGRRLDAYSSVISVSVNSGRGAA